MKLSKAICLLFVLCLLVSSLTGCFKKENPVKEFNSILDAGEAITSGTMSGELTLKIYKDYWDTEELDELANLSSLGADTLFMDADGNMSMLVKYVGKFDKNIDAFEINLDVERINIPILKVDGSAYLGLAELLASIPMPDDPMFALVAQIFGDVKYIKLEDTEPFEIFEAGSLFLADQPLSDTLESNIKKDDKTLTFVLPEDMLAEHIDVLANTLFTEVPKLAEGLRTKGASMELQISKEPGFVYGLSIASRNVMELSLVHHFQEDNVTITKPADDEVLSEDLFQTFEYGADFGDSMEWGSDDFEFEVQEYRESDNAVTTLYEFSEYLEYNETPNIAVDFMIEILDTELSEETFSDEPADLLKDIETVLVEHAKETINLEKLWTHVDISGGYASAEWGAEFTDNITVNVQYFRSVADVLVTIRLNYIKDPSQQEIVQACSIFADVLGTAVYLDTVEEVIADANYAMSGGYGYASKNTEYGEVSLNVSLSEYSDAYCQIEMSRRVASY